VKILNVLYSFFRSIKLAIVLIILIGALSMLATVVPQGEDVQHYFHSYSPFLAQLITGLHFHNFFRSALLLIPAGLFFINLAVCTVARVFNRIRRGAPKRLGPDLIHVGILVLMVAGTINLIGRREAHIVLSKGEYVELPDGYGLSLNSFKHTTYEDGRPKDFVSSVEVYLHNERIMTYDIRVNRPLKIDTYVLYQDSYSSTATVVLQDEDDKRYSLRPGEGFRVADRVFFLMGIKPGRAVTEGGKNGTGQEDPLHTARVIFEELDSDGIPVVTHLVGLSERINRFLVADILITDQTILRVVENSGFVPALIAFIIIGAGLILTFAQKIRKTNNH
jgi:hypothetical protein